MVQTSIDITIEDNLKRDFDAMCDVTATDTVDKLAGSLRKYASPALIPYESEAWAKAVRDKHAAY